MRITRSALAAAVAGAVVLASGAPAIGATNATDHRHGLPDRDSRKGKIRPTSDQRFLALRAPERRDGQTSSSTCIAEALIIADAEDQRFSKHRRCS
jgi:hypothetical protein